MNHGSAFLYSNGRFLNHWFVGVNKVIGNLDFTAKAKKDFEIEAVEYLNQFSQDKAKDKKYLEEIKKRSKGSGVTDLLIMIYGEGNLGEPDENTRCKVIENHYKWVDALNSSVVTPSV